MRLPSSILGIDPGQSGAFAYLDDKIFECRLMPLTEDKEINFYEVKRVLTELQCDHIYLERAIPMAMGAKHAFNYGRGFAALEIAIKLSKIPCTYVEPSKWVKVMHEGISADLKPKAKSTIAVERLFPNLIEKIPKSRTGKLHEGVVDAILIAGFGMRSRLRA